VLLGGLTEALHQLLEVGEETEVNVVWGDKSEKAAQHWTQTLSAFSLHDAGTNLICKCFSLMLKSRYCFLVPLVFHSYKIIS